MDHCQLVKNENISAELDNIEVKIEDYPMERDFWQYRHSLDVSGKSFINQEMDTMGAEQVEEKIKKDSIKIKGTDSNNKIVMCDICDKSFTKKSHFVQHQRTHSGEKPFQCSNCNKSFANKSHLVRHQRTCNGF